MEIQRERDRREQGRHDVPRRRAAVSGRHGRPRLRRRATEPTPRRILVLQPMALDGSLIDVLALRPPGLPPLETARFIRTSPDRSASVGWRMVPSMTTRSVLDSLDQTFRRKNRPCPHWALIEAEANVTFFEHSTFPRVVPWTRAACAASAPAFTICPPGSRVSWRPGWPASAREPIRSPRSIGGPRRSSPVRERSRGARAPGRRSARAAAAALPRLRADLFGRDGLAAGRASPPGGVPRGGALHDLRSTRPCRPLAERPAGAERTVRTTRVRRLPAP